MQAKNNWNGMMKIAAALLCVMMMAGCQIGDNNVNVSDNNNTSSNGNGSDGNGGQSGSSSVDYTNYISGNRSITVKNNTAKQLVAFKGSPSASNLISGIPANSTNHGLKLDKTLFSDNCDFILFIVTEEDYKANINNPESLANKPFTRLYAYYNTNATNNNMVYEISSSIGGECAIILNNMTDYNVELRNNGLYGETIGYTGKQTLQTTFSVESGDYYIFPVFRRFDKSNGEIITAFPKYIDGGQGQVGQSIRKRFSLDSSNKTVEYNAQDWVSGVKSVLSASYIMIQNNSTNGISFYDGASSSPMMTSTGGKMINSGKSMMFEVHMNPVGNNEYTEFVTKSQYRVGSADAASVYITSGSSNGDVNFDFYAGKMYTVVVNGNDMVLNVSTSWKDTSVDVQF